MHPTAKAGGFGRLTPPYCFLLRGPQPASRRSYPSPALKGEDRGAVSADAAPCRGRAIARSGWVGVHFAQERRTVIACFHSEKNSSCFSGVPFRPAATGSVTLCAIPPAGHWCVLRAVRYLGSPASRTSPRASTRATTVLLGTPASPSRGSENLPACFLYEPEEIKHKAAEGAGIVEVMDGGKRTHVLIREDVCQLLPGPTLPRWLPFPRATTLTLSRRGCVAIPSDQPS